MRAYQTGQRLLLLSFFRENSEAAFTVDQIAQNFSDAQISRSAIYRNVDKMAQDGLLRKTPAAEGRKMLYQYVACKAPCERIHLRCEQCGRVFHMEDKADEEALKSVLQKEGFRLDDRATILPGICRECN